jgi:hypothetical protein
MDSYFVDSCIVMSVLPSAANERQDRWYVETANGNVYETSAVVFFTEYTFLYPLSLERNPTRRHSSASERLTALALSAI